jgi:hypothetical protein
VGVAAVGALAPAGAALGHGSPNAYIQGLHHPLVVGAALAGTGAILAIKLIGIRRVQPNEQQRPTTDPIVSLA